ncbi:unnamed protein product, partial [Heterosigma akashiwo]
FEKNSSREYCFCPSKVEPSDSRVQHMFTGKERMFELQIQGKLKRLPSRPLYLGGETLEMMRLSLLARGICRLLLSLVRRVTGGHLHSSFGRGADPRVRPHLAAPLVRCADRLVRTPPGQAPPPLGWQFPESDASKAARRAGKAEVEWDLESTYSFSFHSMHARFQTWELCKLPISGDIPLGRFWNTSPVRFIVYEPGEDPTGSGDHPTATNKYYVALKM